MKKHFLLSSLSLLVLAAFAQGCTATTADDDATESSDGALRARSLEAGAFKLYEFDVGAPSPTCDVNTHLSLETRDGRAYAKLEERLDSTPGMPTCRLAVFPDAREYRIMGVDMKDIGCGSKEYAAKLRVRFSAVGPDSDNYAEIKITDHRHRVCMDRIAGELLVTETRPNAGPGRTTTTKRNLGSVTPPAFCADGRVVHTPSFSSSSDGKECKQSDTHCITRDAAACPALSPRPPSWCSDGTIVVGAPSYMHSADGKECEMPNVHCVTKDISACPQLSSRPPNWCDGGEVVSADDSFMSASDGKECQMPYSHCVTKNPLACPVL